MIESVGATSAQLAATYNGPTTQAAPQQQAQAPPREQDRVELSSSAGNSSSGNGTAFDVALQIQEVQTNNIKLTLDAQTQILDLLA